MTLPRVKIGTWQVKFQFSMRSTTQNNLNPKKKEKSLSTITQTDRIKVHHTGWGLFQPDTGWGMEWTLNPNGRKGPLTGHTYIEKNYSHYMTLVQKCHPVTKMTLVKSEENSNIFCLS